MQAPQGVTTTAVPEDATDHCRGIQRPKVQEGEHPLQDALVHINQALYINITARAQCRNSSRTTQKPHAKISDWVPCSKTQRLASAAVDRPTTEAALTSATLTLLPPACVMAISVSIPQSARYHRDARRSRSQEQLACADEARDWHKQRQGHSSLRPLCKVGSPHHLPHAGTPLRSPWCGTYALFMAMAVGCCRAGLCPSGWTLYLDVSGVEGGDACLSPYTNGGSTVGVTWTVANASCAALGSDTHLLTFAYAGVVNPATGTDVLSVALRAVGTPSIWVGAVRDTLSVTPTSGWSWTDGTSAANLNCGVGCDAWAVGSPR